MRILLFAVLLTAILAALLAVVFRVARFLIRRAESGEGFVERWLRAHSIRGAPRVRSGVLLAFRVARSGIVVVLFYVYLLALFSLFPFSQGWSAILTGLVLGPLRSVGNSFVAYLPSLFFLVVIALVSRIVVWVARLFFDELQSGTIRLHGFDPDWALPTYRMATILVVAFALVVAFPYLPGSGSDAFKGVSIFFGVLFSLAGSSAISNVISGALLTYTGAFRIGDRVKIGETVGDITAKGLLVTHVRTIKNVDVAIPNSMVLGSAVVNYSTLARGDGLILNTSVTIGYDAPWRKVHELLIAAGLATDGVVADPAPFVWQTSLNDYHVSYELNVSTRQAGRMMEIYADLHRNIQDAFNAAGVEIMSPLYAALRDGNTVTIPPPSRPPGYEAPAFRIRPVPEASK